MESWNCDHFRVLLCLHCECLRRHLSGTKYLLMLRCMLEGLLARMDRNFKFQSGAISIHHCYRFHRLKVLLKEAAATHIQACYCFTILQACTVACQHAAAGVIQAFAWQQQRSFSAEDCILIWSIIAKLHVLKSWKDCALDLTNPTNFQQELANINQQEMIYWTSLFQYQLRYNLSLDSMSRSRVQMGYLSADVDKTFAEIFIQRWHHRTLQLRLFQQLPETLSVQRQSTWEQWATDSVQEIAKVLHHQHEKLSNDFILNAAQTWLLPLIEREFPGIGLMYNLVSISLLRSRAYSMTEEHPCWFAIEWTKSG